MNLNHQPVLLKAVLDQLDPKPDGIYIDATFGRGGHSRAILACLGEKGRLIALDKDQEAVGSADDLSSDSRFYIEQSAFSQIRAVTKQQGCFGKVSGILLDLGVSSPQLDDPKRGFGFMHDGPLDMRMDMQQSINAQTWLQQASVREIEDVLRRYGQERYAKRIATAIVRQRDIQPIDRTAELAEIVSKAHPRWEPHKHPATRTFQAIRIHINQELTELETTLEQCLDVLAPGGKLLVISFHSLEDQIVKQFIRRHTHLSDIPRHLPLTRSALDARRSFARIYPPIRPSNAEITRNPRARSATLRIVEKRT